MSLSARKNGLPTVVFGSASGTDISGGEKISGVYVDFVEFIIDSSLGAGPYPSNPPPGQMVLRTSEEALVPDNFYAYYGWGDGSFDYSTTSGFEVFHTYATQIDYTIRLLTNGYLSYGNVPPRTGAGKVIGVNRFGEKTNWAGTRGPMMAGLASPVTINPLDGIPPSFRSVYSMFRLAQSFNWGGWNQWDWANTSVDSLDGFLYGTNYNHPVTMVMSQFINIGGFVGDTDYDGAGMSGWDVSSLTSAADAFSDTDVDADLSSWDVSNVTNFDNAFSHALNFQGIGVDGWDVSSADSLIGMFLNSTLFAADISGWTFKNGAKISNLIKDCTSITDAEVALYLEGWDSNPNQGTGLIALEWCKISNAPRTLSESTYPNAKTAYDNLKDSVANGGKGWIMLLDITWVA